MLGSGYRQGLNKLPVVAHAEPGAHPGTVDDFVLTEVFAVGIQANFNICACHAPAGCHGIPHLVQIEAEITDQFFGLLGIEVRILEVAAATGAEQHLALAMKFIAPGVAAKVIVVVQQQDACIFAGLLLVEEGGSKAADTRTYHHQVVFLVEVLVAGRFLAAPGQGMGGLESTIMTAANTRQRWRVVIA